MANELHALVHAAKCLALAQQQAANKVLPCGSTFLHPEAADQASSMLACFAKVAATTMYLRYGHLIAHNMQRHGVKEALRAHDGSHCIHILIHSLPRLLTHFCWTLRVCFLQK